MGVKRELEGIKRVKRELEGVKRVERELDGNMGVVGVKRELWELGVMRVGWS